MVDNVNFSADVDMSLVLRDCLKEILVDYYSIDTLEKLKVFQRSKNIKIGDFACPTNPLELDKAGILSMSDTDSALTFKLDSESPSKYRKAIDQVVKVLIDKSQGWPFPLSSCNFNESDKCLYIKLNRKKAFKRVISNVCNNSGTAAMETEAMDKLSLKDKAPNEATHSKLITGCGNADGDSLGRHVSSASSHCVLSHGPSGIVDRTMVLLHNAEKFYSSSSEEVSVSFLRAVLVENHLTKLLTASGYEVNHVQYNLPDKARGLCDYCGVGENVIDEESLSMARKNILQSMKSSTYNKTCVENTSENLVLDLKGYIDDVGHRHGNGGYDSNIEECKVSLSDQDDKLSLMTHLQATLLKCPPREEASCVCIYLVSKEHEFTMQQTDLLWQLSSNHCRQVKHLFCVLGPVQQRKGNEQHPLVLRSAEEFIRLREQQMREVSVMKYGDQVRGCNADTRKLRDLVNIHGCVVEQLRQGSEWDSTIKAMTLASLTFELVTTVLRNPVKLDMSPSADLYQSSKGGSFVMYNYARLSTMFQHYEESVSQGTYPSLPDVNSVDFSCLKDEMEWFLLFNYVYTYPLMIKELTAGLGETDTLAAKIPTHKVCNFLSSLCQDLSSYYGRVHILCEPRDHLYSLMFARLYLMKSVQHVIQHGLGLLRLRPLKQV